MRVVEILDVEALSRAMVAEGLSQFQLADELEVDRSSVSRWLSGQTQPSDDHVRKLAKRFDVKPRSLLMQNEYAKPGDDW